MEDLQREELLRIEHLSVTFTQYDGWFSRKTLPVIRDLSLRAVSYTHLDVYKRQDKRRAAK